MNAQEFERVKADVAAYERRVAKLEEADRIQTAKLRDTVADIKATLKVKSVSVKSLGRLAASARKEADAAEVELNQLMDDLNESFPRE